MKLTKENRQQFLLLGIAIAIVLFDFIFLLKPQFSNLAKLNSKRSQLKKDFYLARTQIAQLGKLREQYASLEGSIASGQKWFILEAEIPSMLENISSMANDNQVKIMQIKPMYKKQEPDKQAEGYYPLTVYIIAQGGYHQLGRFINKLENNHIFIKLNELDIVPDQRNYLTHNIKLILEIFLLR